MDTPDLETRVKQILTTSVGIPPEEIKLHAKLADDLGIDSVDLLQLTIVAEGEFDIAISDEHMEEVRTVADIVKLVKRLTDEKGGSARVVPA